MTTPTFSFVMPAYKKQFLGIAIESILNQTYRDFELIIVNDASPENLKEVVSCFNDSHIQYKENAENIGGKDLVANWNHCLEFAKGDFVILATDDDYIEPSYLEEAMKLLDKYPKVDLLRQGVRKIGPKGEPLEYELFPKTYLSAAEFAYFWGCGGLISCISNFIFRRKTLTEAGGFVSFPHAHYSDMATAFALSTNGVACIQNYNVGFRMSDVNLSNQGDYRLALDQLNATQQFIKWMENHLKSLPDDSPGRFFSERAFYAYRNQYVRMIQNLVKKIPKTKMLKAFKAIRKSPYLYKKEKLRMSFDYFV